MSRMFPPQILRRNLPFRILIRLCLLQRMRRPINKYLLGIRTRRRRSIRITRADTSGRGTRARGPDNTGRQTLAFSEEPFESTFEAGEFFERVGFDDEDCEEGDETDEGFDGEGFFPGTAPVDCVVVESIILMPEGDAISRLGVKRQRISNEQEMFKEFGSDIYHQHPHNR